ncbi:hypothetical protein AB0I68_32990 [Streptomyces sp. NPDC050448]|uniref:hypothetical protein n=1 Tax=Streptomyces sp. NPDC050448 TaxID=3155404 RepID=UPI003423800E
MRVRANLDREVIAERLADRTRVRGDNEAGDLRVVHLWPYSWTITSASSVSSAPPLPKRISAFLSETKHCRRPTG